MSDVSIVWFRNDLRLDDNPALDAAVARGGPVVPLFVWSPHEEGDWAPASASRWWLHQSLAALDGDLRKVGSRLVIRRGDVAEELSRLCRDAKATAVLWNRRCEPCVIRRDAAVESSLREAGVTATSHNAGLLFEPGTIRTRQGRPYQVFTPFWNACRAADPPPSPSPAPNRLPAPRKWPSSLALDELHLEPTIDWAGGMREHWRPGAAGAAARLKRFLDDGISRYDVDRDRPDLEGTSSLSPHLHFGEISPRAVWHAAREKAEGMAEGERGGAETFLKELAWREFAHHLLFHFPHTTDEPLRADYAAFPWRDDAAQLRAWQRGRTGYPFVDAAMRQLWATGWMHNRARMVVASFLVKDLLLPWLSGARWFWDTLVDADLANNSLGWQWAAGCGADAAPYFRVFNPVSQGQKFDPHGAYVRRWVPELAALPDGVIHRPWQASASALEAAGVRLGQTYPRPLVDHGEARSRALAALAAMGKPSA